MMKFSDNMQKKMYRFTKEQSQNYLEDAEMSYMEMLRKKSSQTKDKIHQTLSKFKNQSDKGLDAQNDMILYMSDYMEDLMAQGYSEEEAFTKASEALTFTSDSAQAADLNNRFRQYYETRDPAQYEAIGLFYAGFIFLGLGIGTFIGLLAGGGRSAFLAGGWIETAIGAGIGLLIGMGFGGLANAVLLLRR